MSLARVRTVLHALGPMWGLLVLWLLGPLLTGPMLVAKMGAVAQWLESQPLHGVPVWTAAVAVVIGLGILPVYANTILCGWVFGWGLGLASAMTSYLLSTCLGHTIARKVAFQRVDLLIAQSEQAQKVRQALLYSSRRRAVLIVTLFRLTGFPYPAGTLLLTSCGVPLRQSLLGSICGLSPRIATTTFLISRFAQSGARDIQSYLRGQNSLLTLGLGLLLGAVLLGLIAQIARRALTQLAAGAQQDRPDHTQTSR